MAGDWIKMRGNLWDDPRVSALVDATDSTEAAVIGGLYWLWATADQHTEDGVMPGLTLRQIDRKTGVKGLADALVSIGWLADHPEGIRIVNFEDHNGASAKKRCSTAKRVASHRGGNDDVTQPALQTGDASVTCALARGREEIEKSNTTHPSAGEACKAMKEAGMQSVNPSNPKLITLLAAGITIAELADAAKDATDKGKPFAYALATAEGRRRDSATAALPQARASPSETTYQKSMRLRVAEISPELARPDPAQVNPTDYFLTVHSRVLEIAK